MALFLPSEAGCSPRQGSSAPIAMHQCSASCITALCPCMYRYCALTMFASVFSAHFVMCCIAQMVEEGIRASSVPAVLEKCVNDLLDLTDLVRGKLGVQVRVPSVGSRHIKSIFKSHRSIHLILLSSGLIRHKRHWRMNQAGHAQYATLPMQQSQKWTSSRTD